MKAFMAFFIETFKGKFFKVHHWSCQAWRAPGRTFPSANTSLLLGAARRGNLFVRWSCFPQGSPGSSHGAPQDVQKGREMLGKLSSSSGLYRQLHKLWPRQLGALSFCICSSSELTSFACPRAGKCHRMCAWRQLTGALELPELHWPVCHRGPD